MKLSFVPQKAKNFQRGTKEKNKKTIANARLQKAIERNRARQKKREKKQEFSILSKKTTNKTIGQNFKDTRDKREKEGFSSNFKGSKDLVSKSAEYSRKLPARIAYEITERVGEKIERLRLRLIKYCVYCGWIFCMFLLLRLIFAERGIADYYSRQNKFNSELMKLRSIEKHNLNLIEKIEQIKTNRIYQKKLVRDQLGFIARDEYLILFPKETKNSSI